MDKRNVKPQPEHLPTPRVIPLGADQRLLILQKLQGKLEIEVLLEVYTKELEKHIDISRLIWEYNDTCSIVRRGISASCRQTFAVKFGDTPLGVLQYSTPYKLDRDEISMIHTFHRLIAGPLANAIEYSRVKSMALQDYLTGLGNRTSFEQDTNKSIAICERQDIGLVLIMFDMNNFKQVNDTYGHLDGDKVLRRFSQILKEAVRTTDTVYRLGGDEFAALLQPASEESAAVVLRRVQHLVKHDRMLTSYGIGSACGFAEYRKGDNLIALYERADRLLYKHKRKQKS